MESYPKSSKDPSRSSTASCTLYNDATTALPMRSQSTS